MITINAIMKVKPEFRNQYLALVTPLVEAANNEAASLYYAHFEKYDEPNTFAMIERYKDEHAVQAHNDSPHFKQFFSEVGNYLSEEPDIKKSVEH